MTILGIGQKEQLHPKLASFSSHVKNARKSFLNHPSPDTPTPTAFAS